ncbi:uncharacterized protein LOC110924400 [Helianthus annuus]|uniref:uncharacterized protein LOC110924400 n=1 Tax=Helianthus annuus TaxID=4232 RepID=UPI000B8F8DEF|nr:uncharacterized protein LOC110924400 [Helianthus annuus]
MEDANDGLVFNWNIWAPPKANYLIWRALIGKIASKKGLIHRGISLADSLCPRCGLYDEDPDHIFVKCLWAKCIGWNILAWVRLNFIASNNLNDLLQLINRSPGDKVWKRVVYTVAIAMVWRIWIARNEKVFEDVFIPISKTVEQIKEDVFLWLCNRSKLKPPVWEKWKVFDILDMM